MRALRRAKRSWIVRLFASGEEIQRKMEPFRPPTPGIAPSWRAKNRDIVMVRITPLIVICSILRPKQLPETHDGGRFSKPPMTQARTDQGVGELLLGGIEILQREAVSIDWKEMEIATLLFIIEWIDRSTSLGR